MFKNYAFMAFTFPRNRSLQQDQYFKYIRRY